MTNQFAAAITIDDVTTTRTDPFVALGNILRDYNNLHVPPEETVPVWLFARDSTGKVQGGLRGRSFWGWCFVEILAVAETHRGQGIGASLLGQAEDVAKSRGCIGIYLTTVAFQAPDFYAKQGYTRFAHLADFPPGQVHHWFAKRFDGRPIPVTGS
jgi:GNAT superfamily N-acetyltransferase